MGMAASQARFLGLTARKSNVEYQGQQINQQRTALANESANLYQQMMDLEVPTPPSPSDYTQTTYTLEDSANNNAGDFKIVNMKNTHDGSYTVTLSTDVEYSQSLAETYSLYSVVSKDDKGNTLEQANSESAATTIITIRDGEYSSAKLTYIKDKTDPFTENADKTKAFSAVVNQIYKVDPQEANKITGYTTCEADLKDGSEDGKDPEIYFYQDSSGKNHFFTKATLDEMLNGVTDNEMVNLFSENMYTKEQRTDVRAAIEKSDTGRISSIQISDNNDSCPAHLKGKTFSVNTTTTKDEDAYDAAMLDYNYRKGLYDQEIAKINAQTEIIQKEDQQLELRLQQLNTEQQAISTEMDSVSKVIDDNVDKTFKVFA